MAKKGKTPATSRMTAGKTEAPMVVSRSNEIEIAHDEIARLAYARFVNRGCVHGFDLEDWVAAEAELRATQQR